MLGANIIELVERCEFMANMICLAGIPGVGKTTWAENFLLHHPDYHYFSPDAYYGRLNGDDRIRKNTFEVWMAMFRDINTAMKNGHNVLIDSDNLTYAQRTQWIEWFPEFNHILVFFEENFMTCFNRVSQRRRTIPIEVMSAKWKKWERPDERDSVHWKIFKGHHKEVQNAEN